MDEKSIGKNIRATREKYGLSLSAVAERAQLSPGALSKIEQGQTSSPISTLLSIADALGVSLSTFFAAPPTPPQYVVTKNTARPQVVRDGSKFGYSYEALCLEMPNKKAQPFIITRRHGDKEGRFQHGGQEFNYILSGKIEMRIGGEAIVLSEGDAIYFDPRNVHSSKLLSKTPAKILCIFIQTEPADTP